MFSASEISSYVWIGINSQAGQSVRTAPSFNEGHRGLANFANPLSNALREPAVSVLAGRGRPWRSCAILTNGWVGLWSYFHQFSVASP